MKRTQEASKKLILMESFYEEAQRSLDSAQDTIAELQEAIMIKDTKIENLELEVEQSQE